MRFHILVPGDPLVNAARQAHLAALSAAYSGWSADLDRLPHDPRSIWFGVTDSSEAVFQATCRLQFQGPQLPRLPDRACEASGLSYRSTFDLINLLHAQGQWMVANLVGNCYAWFDTADHFLKRFATEVLGFQPLPDATVLDSKTRNRASSRAVSFQSHRLTPEDLMLGVWRLNRLGASLRYEGPSGRHLPLSDSRASRFGLLRDR